jgi:hypothetical protein
MYSSEILVGANVEPPQPVRSSTPLPEDFISDFFSYTADVRSPELFRTWTAITIVGAALERRVWVRTGPYATFPNMFTLLVAPPGTGKKVIEKASELLGETLRPDTKIKAFHVAPQSITKAALIDTLKDSKQTTLTRQGKTFVYHALFIGAEEFSVLLPSHDPEYEGVLNSLWNNSALFHERRRHGDRKETLIEFPILNMLAGVQPSFLSQLPPETWASGLSRRFIMIYSAEQRIRDPFLVTVDEEELKEKMLAKLRKMSDLQGQITWSPEAQSTFTAWVMGGSPPRPIHSKLTAYVSNREMNVMKLAGISAVSRGQMQIAAVDLARAMEWLLNAETIMPDIFRAMISKSDQDIIDELYLAVSSLWKISNGKPVDGAFVWHFVSSRTTSDKVEKIINLADKMQAVVRIAGTENFKPMPRWQIKME